MYVSFALISLLREQGLRYDWRGLMILDRSRKSHSYEIDGVPSNFSTTLYGTKVSTHVFHTVSEPYENRWGTMVTLQTLKKSAAKETSLLTTSNFLQ